MSVTVASYGGGVNSTAMLIGLAEREEFPDLILFSDTGGEKPETYAYVRRFAHWLVRNGMQPIREVAAPNTTLEESCLRLGVLPPIAFGFKTCSQRFKSEPQNKFLNNWEKSIEAWKRGEKVVKLIGYDAGEPHRAKAYSDDKYTVRYPLVEWGWDREECIEAIARAGLCAPPKKWRVQTMICGKRIWMGYFDTKEEASLKYEEQRKLLHGEFAMNSEDETIQRTAPPVEREEK